jgi:hypothetical protein
VPLARPMHSAADDDARAPPGCPIRIRAALRSLAAPRPRFAALRVLPRHLAPKASPQHPSPLGVFAGHDGYPPCSTHIQTREFVTSARTNDPPAILELARFGKIEANHIATIALAHETLHALRPRTLSRQGLHSRSAVVQVLRRRPRPYRETAAPANVASPAQHQVLRAPS